MIKDTFENFITLCLGSILEHQCPFYEIKGCIYISSVYDVSYTVTTRIVTGVTSITATCVTDSTTGMAFSCNIYDQLNGQPSQ